MSERPIRPINGRLENRSDYDTRFSAPYHQAIDDAVEDILIADGVGADAMRRYSYDDGVVYREFECAVDDLGTSELDEVLLFRHGELAQLSLQRLPIRTEYEIAREEYLDSATARRGYRPLRAMTRITMREYIYGSNGHPFLNHYYLEEYAGRSVVGTREATDIVRGEGLEAREMTPYDFRQLSDLLDAMKRARGIETTAKSVAIDGER